MDIAKTAGMQRLLRDLGYRIAATEGRSDKTADAALADFRKRSRVAAGASAADLFDALETGALKVSAPAGYAVCNDTAKPVAMAIGEKAAGDWISHGWWKIVPGSCAKAITYPLTAENIYLFVQKIPGPALVGGHDNFCIADIEFDIQGRLHCKDRGLAEAGFAETHVRGLAGFTVHVGETGIVQAPQRYKAMSK